MSKGLMMGVTTVLFNILATVVQTFCFVKIYNIVLLPMGAPSIGMGQSFMIGLVLSYWAAFSIIRLSVERSMKDKKNRQTELDYEEKFSKNITTEVTCIICALIAWGMANVFASFML